MEKIIHYCWFGGSPLPESAIKCIDSWKKHFPDYEIRKWDEKSFNVSACAYAKEAYDHGRWAFVSDYARFWILYHYGGLYFDTDVEVIRSMEDILSAGSFMGCEKVVYDDGMIRMEVASGLGMAAEKGMPVYREILAKYETIHFEKPDGTLNYDTVVRNVTEILKKHGFQGNGEIEEVAGIRLYPPEYFCPMDYFTGEMKITANTRSIHHFDETWKNPAWIRISEIKRQYAAVGKRGCIREKLALFPWRIKNRIENEGLQGLFRFN